MFESKFDKLYNLILEQLLVPISNNNFPENQDINIRNDLMISKNINIVLLTKHCIKNKKTQYNYHGVNYIPITRTKFFELVEAAISQLFKEFSIQYLSTVKLQRFQF